MASSSSEKVKTGTGNDAVVNSYSSGLKKTKTNPLSPETGSARVKQQQQKQQQPAQHNFYGDIVNGPVMGVITPFLARKIVTETRIDAENSSNEGVGVFDAALMVGATGISALFQ